MYSLYVRTILNGQKFEADKGSTGGDVTPESNEQDETESDDEETPEDKPAKKQERTFTRGEVAKIVKEETQKALDEAKKLENMNESERLQYDLEQAKAELATERKKNSFNAMSKEASKMLASASITADDEMLDFVVKETAEETKVAVDSFIALVDKAAEAKTKLALTGKAPKVNLQPGKQMTKDEIMKIKDPVKRQQAIKDNIHLFKK